MGEVFIKLLNMSITASWLILAILCVRLLFRKIPKWVNCLLWGVVAIRLLFPFSIESEFSLQPSAEPIKTSTRVEGEVMPYVPSVDSNLSIVENMVNPILTETFAYQESESVAPLQVFTGIAGSIWICGMIVLLIFAVVSMVKLYLSVRESVRYKENVYICDAVKSPFILGIIKPRIYLSSALGEDEMHHIIAHEKAHLRRKDHLWKPFGYLLLCIYWFNPLCWIAYIMLCKDIELACDEKVIKNMSFDDKKEYSRVLLSCATGRRLVFACPLAFGEVGVRERVKSVLKYKKPAFWITMIAIVVCIIVAICFLTNPSRKYQIRVTIPAGSTESFCYSDEEISSKGNTITISNGEGLGDTEVVLLPVECREENAYEPTYMTPDMPVKMDVERGAWFKIGVNMQNPSEENIDVYVSVSNVDVRISSIEDSSQTPIVDGVTVNGINAAVAQMEGANGAYTLTITQENGDTNLQKAYERYFGTEAPNSMVTYNMELTDSSGIPLTQLEQCNLTVVLPLPKVFARYNVNVFSLDSNGQLKVNECTRVKLNDEDAVEFQTDYISVIALCTDWLAKPTEEEENSEKVIWEDLDGNGEEEYFTITNAESGILSLYFNNELIYQYEDQYLNIVGIDKQEYIDLDNDGEKEIFVAFWPRVNSMPLVEWFALKQGETGWELMEMYHQDGDMSQNAFPISVVLKEKDYGLSIICEGLDKEILYDATKHYEKKKGV